MSRSKQRGSKPAAPPTGEKESPGIVIPPGGGARTGLLRLARLLFTLALGISLYLAYTSYTSGSVAGCGAGSNCGEVLTSRWAYWFTLPISVPASVFYLVLLGTSFFSGSTRSPQVQARAWTGLIAGAFAVLGAALWFIGLQAVIIGSWCLYCMTAHLLGGTGALLLLLAAPFVIRGPETAEPVLFGVNRRAAPAIIGILALVPLVFGQYLSRPPSSSVATLASGGGETNSVPAEIRTNESSTIPPAVAQATAPSRQFSLHNGKFVFDVHEAPVIGKPDAPHIIVCLFDYTCTHCRREHFILKRVQATFSNELAVVLIPMPLDMNCNPLLKSTPPEHVNACDYARIGMAVWRARPEVYGAYEEWFFAPERPLPVPEVKAKAIEMTGRADFDAVMADPWIDNWIKLGRDLFKANWDLTGRNFLPMLNVGQVLSSGELKSDDELYDILEKHEGLKRPSPPPPAASQ